MKRLALPAISLAALMASGIAFAQTTPEQQPAQDMQQKQDCVANPQADGCPAQPQAQQPATPDSTATDSASSVTIDASKAMLATSVIGSSVFTAADENIGDINDLIVDNNGTIQAAIVGVGGFLGMGEKDVAVPLNKLNVTRDENNAIKLTIAASRAELENAPAFDKTLFVVKSPAPDTSLPSSPGGSTTTPQQ